MPVNIGRIPAKYAALAPKRDAVVEAESGRRVSFGELDRHVRKLANGLPLPKAGLMAELEGQIVAASIAAAIRGEDPARPFDGRGFCFMEMGKTRRLLPLYLRWSCRIWPVCWIRCKRRRNRPGISGLTRG